MSGKRSNAYRPGGLDCTQGYGRPSPYDREDAATARERELEKLIASQKDSLAQAQAELNALQGQTVRSEHASAKNASQATPSAQQSAGPLTPTSELLFNSELFFNVSRIFNATQFQLEGRDKLKKDFASLVEELKNPPSSL